MKLVETADTPAQRIEAAKLLTGLLDADRGLRIPKAEAEAKAEDQSRTAALLGLP